MKIPTLDINLFYLFGAGVFGIQGICSIIIFFVNPQNIFTAIYAWAGIFFAFLLVYLFLSLRQGNLEVSKGDVSEEEIKNLLVDLQEGRKVVSNGKK